jgi:DNA-binding NarL/FixJ family response regulator
MTATDSSIRIMLVDDHPLLREGVSSVVERQHDMQLVAEAMDGEQAIELYRRLQPDITLMDLQMPGMGGVEAIRAIVEEFPNARVIVLTTYKGDVQALRALKAGATGYLLKSMLRKDLLETIRQVHAGRRCIPPEIANEIATHIADDALSAREVQVLGHVAGGRSNKVIAAHMGISEETVKTHMKSILAKLDANDRTHAVTIAMRRGILDV